MRMWSGRAFQVAGPACENARSPNFVRSSGREQSIDEVEDERSPERDLLAPTDSTVSVRYAGFTMGLPPQHELKLTHQGASPGRGRSLLSTTALCVCVGSPFKFHVIDVSRVTAKGPGLTSVVCRQPTSFTVSTSSTAGHSASLKHNDIDVVIIGQSLRYSEQVPARGPFTLSEPRENRSI